jgi:NADH-quinone oxidoreductase subunit J
VTIDVLFYIAAVVSVVATLRVITHLHAVHALLYLVVSVLAVALIFYLLGAAFAAALEIIIYAGAIMVLFVFVIMLLNQGPLTVRQERQWLTPAMWVGPVALSLVLLAEVTFIIASTPPPAADLPQFGPKDISISLYGPYVIGLELASLLLLAGLVGAYHLGRRLPRETP